MPRRRACTCAIAALALLLASCAAHQSPSGAVREPVSTSWLTGTWRGTASQVAGSRTQDEAPVTVVFAADGTWKASTGASGSSRIEGDKVILEGAQPGGSHLRYTLKGRGRSEGGDELWGMVEASFGNALVSLKRSPGETSRASRTIP